MDLYETLKKTESTRVKRKEQAEKAKNDVMNNPANRRRYMIVRYLSHPVKYVLFLDQ